MLGLSRSEMKEPISNSLTTACLFPTPFICHNGLLASSALAALSQLFCFNVFHRISRSSSVFIYFRACSTVNIVICLFIFAQCFYEAFFPSNFWATFAIAHVITPLTVMCYLSSILLDILTTLDRLAIFDEKSKSMMSRLRPQRMCMLAISLSILFGLPCFFFVSVHEHRIHFDNKTEHIWYLKLSPVLTSVPGRILSGVMMFIMNVFLMIYHLTISIRLLVYFRQHVRRKLVRSQEIMQPMYQHADLRSTLMVSLICFATFFENALLLVCDFDFLVLSDVYRLGKIQIITVICYSSRQVLDPILFLIFNSVFRKEASRMLHFRS